MLLDLAIILSIGLIFSKIVAYFKIPDIIGMIFAGIFINYLSLLNSNILEISADLKQIALVIILTRAGLTLNINDMKKSSKPMILLSFLPAIFEILGVSLISMLIFKMDLVSSLILGSVLSAVSPAIIVPRMINFKKLGYGKKRNVPDLILAGASVDDIFVITLFYSFLSFDSSNLLILPINIILGIIFGVICGIFLNLFVKFFNSNHFVIFYFCLNLFLLEIANFIPFSALLSIMVSGIILNTKNFDISSKIEEKFLSLWSVFSILLFVFVGISINFTYIFSYGIKPIILIVFALIFRSIGTFLSVFKTNLQKNEKIFCIISYLPKATVQAGIGYIPLSLGLPFGELILAISAISIIITAPLGAFLIDFNYKKLLKQD